MEKSKIFVCIFTVLLGSFTMGQMKPNQQAALALKILPDFASLDGEGPLVMSIQVQNNSRGKIGTENLPRVILEKIPDDIEQAVTIEESFQAIVRVDPKSSYAKNDFLAPGATVTLSVDLQTLEWNDPKLSILSNSKLTGILSPGRYRLSVSMLGAFLVNGRKTTKCATSNEIYLRHK